MTGFVRPILVAGSLALTFAVGAATGGHALAALLGPGAVYIGGGIPGISTGELDERLAWRGYATFGRTATGRPGASIWGAYIHLIVGGAWRR